LNAPIINIKALNQFSNTRITMTLRNKKYYYHYSIFIPGSFIIICIIIFLISVKLQTNRAYAQTLTLVSTRGHFNLDNGKLVDERNLTDYDAFDIPGLQLGTSCPNEAAIYVHGVWRGKGSFLANLENETEVFNRARLSLSANNYSIPVMSFSWDSNTTNTPNGIGWSIAKTIAENNGPRLAHFMLDYKITCPDTDIRVIAHSLGAKVILNALLELTNNPTWNSSSSSNFKIESVHLMGAAVDNERVSIGPVDTDYPR